MIKKSQKKEVFHCELLFIIVFYDYEKSKTVKKVRQQEKWDSEKSAIARKSRQWEKWDSEKSEIARKLR
jgi:hypothetical protein